MHNGTKLMLDIRYLESKVFQTGYKIKLQKDYPPFVPIHQIDYRFKNCRLFINPLNRLLKYIIIIEFHSSKSNGLQNECITNICYS